ncbi:MAG: hypothetical protein GY913_19355 [Proteobacteria bacterium]|nr:hypothetical protein [Pseudomonadota bacterium]MCP4919068.1 hypothetical protein [Pseudomonadota bacterium]
MATGLWPPTPRMREAVWWLLLAAFVLGYGSVLWISPTAYLGDDLGDGPSARFYYMYVAEVVLGNLDADQLGPFGYPQSGPRIGEFPTLVEALLGVPFYVILPHPRAFQAAMAQGIFVNALGAAVLARALGARGPGVFVAGALAATAFPPIRELVLGRPNGMWIGLVSLALGLSLLALGTGPSGPRPVGELRPKAAVTWFVALTVTFYFAGLAYPPTTIFLLPLGLVLVALSWHRGLPKRLAMVAGAAVAAMLLGFDDLSLLAEFGTTRHEMRAPCPTLMQRLPLIEWFSLDTEAQAWRAVMPGLGLASWILAPLALFQKKGRVAIVVVMVFIGVTLPMSSGECLAWTDEQSLDALLGTSLQEHLSGWLRIPRMFTDRSRVAVSLTTLTAVLSGVGLTTLSGFKPSSRLWTGVGLAVAILLGGLAVAHSSKKSMAVLQPRFWHLQVDPTDTVLEALPPGPVAIVPYALWIEIESVLRYPDRDRYHPWGRREPRPREGVAGWIDSVGWNTWDANPPSLASRAALGPSWLVLEPGRCDDPRNDQRLDQCDPDRMETGLRAVLGEPLEYDEGVLVWRLDAGE